MSEDSAFLESNSSPPAAPCVRLPVTATASEMAALRYMATAVGDDWPLVARCLHLRASSVHGTRRRAAMYGLTDQQTRLEVLLSWFRAQPRAANKVSSVTQRDVLQTLQSSLALLQARFYTRNFLKTAVNILMG